MILDFQCGGRPSYRELDRKLQQARSAIQEGRWAILEPDVIHGDLLELDVLISELPSLLLEALGEITPKAYRGNRPPARSYEEAIKNAELFSFVWQSKTLGCNVYLKFALKGDIMWLVSFHKDRENRET
ncbi:hypothetical protein SAMN02745206_01262 [Desulfacinum infernum DSM 9756]|uniref:Uncharacterized protein n=1 Tax=Desulfacinum infernum DSM 9756 TaxID=1121391 RepID=A0A1M4YIE3_9BACT|nr:hypothetical protein [Desulfacinum infernum]SHF05282.1 hypothetical protein SAMN02745206_01262 [Desulfacinum infernum DSM 9756]